MKASTKVFWYWQKWGPTITGITKAASYAALVFSLIAIGLAALSVRKAADDASALVQETQTRVVHTSQNLNAILIQIGLAADEARRASMDERQYLTTLNSKITVLLDQTASTMATAQDAIASIDKNSTASFEALRLSLEEVKRSTAAVQPLLQEATKTTTSINKVVSDPNLPKTFEHVEKTTANFQESSEDIKRKVKEITKPTVWWKSMCVTALKIAVGIKQLVF